MEDNADPEEQPEEENFTTSTHFTTKKSTTLLPTALVPVKDVMGQVTTLRSLID